MVGGHCARCIAGKLPAEESYEIWATEREEKIPAYQKYEAAYNNSDNSSANWGRDFVELLVCYPHQLHNSPQQKAK
jgi:hypothetical protein